MMRAKRSFVQWCQWWVLRQHPDPAKTMMGPHCWPHLGNFQQGYSDLEVPFYSRMAIPTLRWCLNFCSICSSLVPWLSWQWVGDLPISILLQLILLDNNKNVQEQCWSVVLAKKTSDDEKVWPSSQATPDGNIRASLGWLGPPATPSFPSSQDYLHYLHLPLFFIRENKLYYKTNTITKSVNP